MASVLSTGSRFQSTQPCRQSLKYTGSLEQLESFEVTTIIGREYPHVQLSHLLNDKKSDVLLRDLAVIVSQRGVVFFRNQDLTTEQQKALTQKLGVLSGKPDSSTLHRHPLFDGPETKPMDGRGKRDQEVYVIENKSEWVREKNIISNVRSSPASNAWHTDITFENVPSDYACLKMVVPAKSGGDTLWASGYELYDRLSPSFASYLATLSTTSRLPYFKQCAEEHGFTLISPRGSPHNALACKSDSNGATKPTEDLEDFAVTHPLVRTNPVTGWRGVYAMGQHFGKINELSGEESTMIKAYLERVLIHNHDLQVRFRWGQNDVAIWDNRSVLHSPTYDDVGERFGYRVISIGEKPYLDISSMSRRGALAAAEAGLRRTE